MAFDVCRERECCNSEDGRHSCCGQTFRVSGCKGRGYHSVCLFLVMVVHASLTNLPGAFQVSWWRYPGTTLLTQGSINFAEQDGYKLAVFNNSYQLSVTNATLKHSGLYICQVALNEVELYRKNFSINVEGE